MQVRTLRHQPKLSRQRGFGLAIFVFITAAIAVSYVASQAGVFTRNHLNGLAAEQKSYLAEVRDQVESYYRDVGYRLDSPTAAATSGDELLDLASVRRRFNIKAAFSNLLPGPDGFSHRRLVIWVPSETDVANPPDLAAFATTGEYKPCADTEADCREAIHVIFDSLDVQQALARDTRNRLERVALKAQAYFQARTYQDPDRVVSRNHFRPEKGCEVQPMQLECLDVYSPLAAVTAFEVVPTHTARVLGLTQDELISAWGMPIQGSNIQDAESAAPPYTMVFRAQSPFGTVYSVRAVQQL